MSFTASRPLPLANTPNVIIITAVEPREIEATRGIFREYADSLDVDLCFQNFEDELASLPGDYAEPRGALLLALIDASPQDGIANAPEVTRGDGRPAHVAACCGLRPLDAADYPNAAEMKRLYVRPAFRGMGLGRQLAEAILDAARGAGYACVLLDTLDDMEAARTLYEDLGFEEVPPYYHNPIAGSHYLKVDL
ncbi:GNAT family N-acetyltransferase [Variovorax soli]|jgi:ribosomal protein S18 acetylase RimI-like enzyme|uniref:GNAT family N-acetyltransferase n=1 Tax=Variovorax soli TaxID=376815 RepID=UPI000839B08B|nr:GNAT family N-acetyltransferase [Variovorax soli]